MNFKESKFQLLIECGKWKESLHRHLLASTDRAFLSVYGIVTAQFYIASLGLFLTILAREWPIPIHSHGASCRRFLAPDAHHLR